MSLTPSIPSTASSSTSSHDVPSSMDPALIVPTETQARELKQLLDSGESELSKLDRTITTLSLLPFKSQSSQQSESLFPVRGALSALRRFPPEILGYIFVMCAEHDRTNRTSIADARRAPVLLGHVCSRWRIISHGNPRLWDRVVLPTSSWWMAYPPVDRTLFFQILWGSHSRLKDITLEIKPREIAQLAPRQDALFPQLATLSIHFSAADCPRRDDCSRNRRRNRCLFLEGIDLVRILAGFRHAPFLHSLDLSCVNHCEIPLSPFIFPWAQLKNLRVQIPSALFQAQEIFLQCPQLERARFSVRELDAPYREGMPPHVHRNLRELYLAVEEDDFDASLFLRDFTFPSLERISIDVRYLDPSAFQLFYTRSNFKLRHLHLQRIFDMTADDLFAFIQFCPTLQSISIINCECAYEAALFEIFTHDRNAYWRAISLPMLTTLTVGLDYGCDGTAVADMADCLSEHGGQDSPFPVLERIYLMTHSCEPNARYDEAVEARLAAVAATGFLIRDVSPDPDDITPYIKKNGRWT
ncbi:hypothetical protein FB451DRAFT_1263346 [Mycena latifolia]|nr:hypothetical protein FB451DRAFT_1263346 [Mycena latifolia]